MARRNENRDRSSLATTAVAAAPGVAVMVVLVALAGREGGYAPSTFLPATLFVLAVLVVVLATTGAEMRGRRPVVAALVLLTAFTGWEASSIAWAEVRGDAWDGANRTLLYLVVYALFATHPWRPGIAAILVGSYSLALTGIGLAAFLRAVDAGAAAEAFIAGRFAAPIDYPNATAALFLAAVWPALYLAARREVPPLVRGVMLASVVVLTELALMSQSRGSVVAVPLVGILLLALAPNRVRLLIVAVPVALAVLLARSSLLAVYSAVVSGEGTAQALSAARDDVLLGSAALLVFGVLLGVLDGRVDVSPRVARITGRSLGVAGAAGAVTGLVVLLLAFGDPMERAADGWREFKQDERVREADSHLTSGLGSKRYDLWRVAVLAFRSSPVTGIGSDNFATVYLRERQVLQEPLYPHSLELKILSQMGVVGAMLFAGFLVFAVAAAWRSTRRGDPFGRGLAAAGLASFAYWLAHGSIDWFWEIPGLGAAAFAWLGLAGRTGGAAGEVPARTGVKPPALAALVVVSVAIGASLLSPWISAKDVDVAAVTWAEDPQRAFDRLDRARRLNPLSDQPDVIAGVIAGRVGDRERQERAFRQALERNPSSWYAHLELAMLEALEGRQAAALAHLREAAALNPHEPVITDVQRLVSEGEEIRSAAIRRVFRERIMLLTGERQR